MIVPGSANSLLLAQGASTGYNLTKSLRFRSSASAYLNRTFGTPTNNKIWTMSFWLKRGAFPTRCGVYSTTGVVDYIEFGGGGTQDDFEITFNNTSGGRLITSQLFRDPAAWYNIIISVDTTQATASNRVKLYVNGNQVTSFSTSSYPSQNYNTAINSAVAQYIGADYNLTAGQYFDGYLTEYNFIDGQQLTPSSFGENNADTGVWQPKRYTGTYGTNGFYLPFTDTSSASPTGLGKDFSGTSSNVIVGSATNTSTTLTVVSTTGISVGNIVTGTGIPSNTYVTAIGVLQVTLSQAATATTVSNNYTFSGNNWTCNNISLTAGSTYDSMTDVPTLTSATTANYCVLNPLDTSVLTASDGNLKASSTTAAWNTIRATVGITSGKFYWEYQTSSNNSAMVGIETQSASLATYIGNNATGYAYNASDGNKYNNGTGTSYGATYTSGDIIGVAFDADNRTLTFYKNNTSQGTAYSSIPAGIYIPAVSIYASGSSLVTNTINFGQQPFTYTPPTGYVALNTYNLPTSTIVAGNKYMDATTYNGTNSTLSVTNAGTFKPDLIWLKIRNTTSSHVLVNSVDGANKTLYSNQTSAEETATAGTGVTSFNSNGFTLGTDLAGTTYGSTNNSGGTYVGWQWQAGQGTTSSNTNGSITSTVSVNASAGFSIVTYTGTGANATVGHGLGVAPSFIIGKKRSSTGNWQCWHSAFTGTQYISLNSTTGVNTNSTVFNGSPTSTIFNIGTDTDINASGATNVAYCWAEIAGFSKFGSYTANASADGPFIYTGFRPAYVMFKKSSGTGDWLIVDNKRDTYNVELNFLLANSSNAEASTQPRCDFLSNGIKVRAPSGYTPNETAGDTYIYAAFAENPFKNALAR